MRRVQRPETFEAFYYRKVGLGEGCGCAERVIDTRDLDRIRLTSARVPGSRWLSRLRARLTRGPSTGSAKDAN